MKLSDYEESTYVLIDGEYNERGWRNRAVVAAEGDTGTMWIACVWQEHRGHGPDVDHQQIELWFRNESTAMDIAKTLVKELV